MKKWCEEGEKSSKFFLNLEKTKVVLGIIKKLEIEDKEINDQMIQTMK